MQLVSLPIIVICTYTVGTLLQYCLQAYFSEDCFKESFSDNFSNLENFPLQFLCALYLELAQGKEHPFNRDF